MRMLIQLLLVILVSTLAAAATNTVQVSIGVSPSGAVVCTGGSSPVFYWDMESDMTTPAAITTGTPAGCSAGDDTPVITNVTQSTTAGTVTNGTYSMSVPTGYDRAIFDISARDIFDEAEGTVTFDVYCNEVSASSRLFVVRDSSGYGTAEFYVSVVSDSVAVDYVDTVGTTDIESSAIVADTQYSVEAKWRQTGSPNLSVSIDGGTAVTDDTDLAVWGGAPDELAIGNHGDGTNGGCYIDNLRIYDSWQ